MVYSFNRFESLKKLAYFSLQHVCNISNSLKNSFFSICMLVQTSRVFAETVTYKQQYLPKENSCQ